MTTLRSGLRFNPLNRYNARRRRHLAPAGPKPQNEDKSLRKTKSAAKNVGRKPGTRPPGIDAVVSSRNIRYRHRTRANELGKGDRPETLREKRRWVQREFDTGQISGKAARELRDLYSKKNIGNLRYQLTLAQNLTAAATEAKERLERDFEQIDHTRFVVSVRGQPSIKSHTETVGASSDSKASPAPAITAAANDAAARQRLLDLGLELADYSTADGEADAALGDMEDGEELMIKEEDADE